MTNRYLLYDTIICCRL